MYTPELTAGGHDVRDPERGRRRDPILAWRAWRMYGGRVGSRLGCVRQSCEAQVFGIQTRYRLQNRLGSFS